MPNYGQVQAEDESEAQKDARRRLFQQYERNVRGASDIPDLNAANEVPNYEQMEAEERREAAKLARRDMFEGYENAVRGESESREARLGPQVPDYQTSEQKQADKERRRSFFEDYQVRSSLPPG